MHKKPKPGDMGFSIIGGWTGFFVSLGLAFNGDGTRYTHVFVVLDDDTVMEAQPEGCRIVPLSEYENKSIYLDWGLTDQQRVQVVAEARKLEGIGYSFMSYLFLALARFNIVPSWLTSYLKNSKRLICSQLVDEVYRRAGIQLFNDGRVHHDVTPGDLLMLYLERDWIVTGSLADGLDPEAAAS